MFIIIKSIFCSRLQCENTCQYYCINTFVWHTFRLRVWNNPPELGHLNCFEMKIFTLFAWRMIWLINRRQMKKNINLMNATSVIIIMKQMKYDFNALSVKILIAVRIAIWQTYLINVIPRNTFFILVLIMTKRFGQMGLLCTMIWRFWKQLKCLASDNGMTFISLWCARPMSLLSYWCGIIFLYTEKTDY